MLEVTGLDASYGPVQVLRGVDLHVDEAEVVVLLGANGAGKTTTIRAICQMVDTKGSVTLGGAELVGTRPEKMAGLGIAHVPQGRGTFPELTVDENLQVGAFVRKDRAHVRGDIERSYMLFPRLGERRTQLAGSLSGGEQQMLAVARALMSRPRLLLLDEPSLGLAPLIIQGLFARFNELNREEGVTMLIVEQNANLALDIADRAYVLEAGRIVLSGSAAELRSNDAVRRAYLGF
ncbi:MAG TPA: ABC transporter ATP-binding protein [Ilumatobacteraceae bacterium]|nr:ABC transporter ATP-binding protein [Ilumatobacteraceae bacterium]